MDSESQKALNKACAFAIHHHRNHRRKGTSIPYVSHLLQVAGSVFEHGGDVDQAIAALCHDTLEDCDEVNFKLLESEFGQRVAKIVQDCTDTFEADTPDKKSAWKARKEAYLTHLSSAAKDSVLVAACDKLHNLSCIVADVNTHGTDYLKRFSGSPQQQNWYFSTFLENTRDRLPKRLILRFEETLLAYQKQIAPTPPPNRQ
jgi:GTP pyrophosphokinase